MALFHIRSGSGEPLLLIQGMSGTHLSWGEPFLAGLRDGFDVVAFDHRGIGDSPPAKEPFTIADLAEDVVGLLDELGWDTAHVLGISMGGMVAQELALRHGDRIRTLTLGCTFCGGPGAALTAPEVAQRIGEAMLSGDQRRAVRTMYEVNVSPAFAAEPAHWAAFEAMALAVRAPRRTILLQSQAIGGFDIQAELGAIDRPTLVLHGTRDEMLGAANGELIASRIPGARLELLDGVGHLFWLERPERSAALLREHALGAAAAA